MRGTPLCTAETHLGRFRRFIFGHHKQHPADIGPGSAGILPAVFGILPNTLPRTSSHRAERPALSLLDHTHIDTAQIRVHLLNQPGLSVRSPRDS
jgi:hypothetical protein